MSVLKNFWEHVQVALSCSVFLEPDACSSCWLCYQVCPVGCFRLLQNGAGIELRCPELCIACGACQLQCPSGAAQLRPRETRE